MTTIGLSDKVLHPLTLVTLGVMAYVFADMIHEAIGHGLGCVLVGGEVKLLTSVYFRAEVHNYTVDALGPLANLIAGLLLYWLLSNWLFLNVLTALLWLHTMAYNLFWFAWMGLYGGLTYTGDFAFAISTRNQLIVWRLTLLVAGLLIFWLGVIMTSRVAQKQFDNSAVIRNRSAVRQMFSIPYLSACTAALVAVSFYRPLSFDVYYEAIHFPMLLPVVFVPALLRTERVTLGTSKNHWQSQLIFIVLGLTLFVCFCLTMGRGMSF